MSRLVKPTDYAKEQNISRQAIYAKIKKGLLDSKTIDGKIYIILQGEEMPSKSKNETPTPPQVVNIVELLTSKEETISVLKESIKDLKQTNTEINTTLRGEIELLKQVFTEMRNLYVKQVEYMGEHQLVQLTQDKMAQDTTTPQSLEKTEQKEQEQNDNNTSDCWVDIETFLDRANVQKSKKRKKIKKALLLAYQENDPRIKIESDTLFISCYDFYEDILEDIL